MQFNSRTINQQSETAGLSIPDIDLTLQHGTLGGRFTTLEGILIQVYEELSEKVFASGDASHPDDKRSFEQFLKNLKEVGICHCFHLTASDTFRFEGHECRTLVHRGS